MSPRRGLFCVWGGLICQFGEGGQENFADPIDADPCEILDGFWAGASEKKAEDETLLRADRRRDSVEPAELIHVRELTGVSTTC